MSPGQRQVGRNRLTICNTNNLSEEMTAADGDVKNHLGRMGGKRMKRQ